VAARSPERGRWVNGMGERVGIKRSFLFKKYWVDMWAQSTSPNLPFLNPKIAIGLTCGTQCHASPDWWVPAVSFVVNSLSISV
jgi:hypothetical protein